MLSPPSCELYDMTNYQKIKSHLIAPFMISIAPFLLFEVFSDSVTDARRAFQPVHKQRTSNGVTRALPVYSWLMLIGSDQAVRRAFQPVHKQQTSYRLTRPLPLYSWFKCRLVVTRPPVERFNLLWLTKRKSNCSFYFECGFSWWALLFYSLFKCTSVQLPSACNGSDAWSTLSAHPAFRPVHKRCLR